MARKQVSKNRYEYLKGLVKDKLATHKQKVELDAIQASIDIANVEMDETKAKRIIAHIEHLKSVNQATPCDLVRLNYLSNKYAK